MTHLPVICLPTMTEAQIDAYIIADNRLAELAEWDTRAPALEFEAITEFAPEFDLSLTGFDTPDIDLMFQGIEQSAESEPAPPLIDRDRPTISQFGDLWLLGRHLAFCGDARVESSYGTLLSGGPANMVFTDPPYNVRIAGNVSGAGRVQHQDFAMASGEMTEAEYTNFLQSTFMNLAAFSVDGSIHYVCMDWRHILETEIAGRAVYGPPKQVCVWNKDNAGMGTFYRSQHDIVFVFKNGSTKHVNNFELGQKGRYRTNVWSYPGVNSFRGGRQSDLDMHPTVKPLALVADAIRDCSKRNGLILDPFGGSGTTIMAAEETGRCAAIMEIDPRYVDVCIRRWQDRTGDDARHAETGETFAARESRIQPD